MGHVQVTKIYNEEKIYSIRTLVVVHILNFKRDLFVLRLSILKLIIYSKFYLSNILLVSILITARKRDLVESSKYAQLMFLYCIFSLHYIFL